MYEDRKKRKKSSWINTQDDTDAKGESDSSTADEPAATEKTSSSEEAVIPGQHPG